MKIFNYTLGFQELPTFLNIIFAVTGCSNKCDGCSWEFLSEENSSELTPELYDNILFKFQHHANAVVFLGGDWEKDTLIKYLKLAKEKYNLATCLYTGKNNLEDIDFGLIQCLDFLKIGRYEKSKGGLENPNTNQKFFDLRNNELKDITNIFWNRTDKNL